MVIVSDGLFSFLVQFFWGVWLQKEADLDVAIRPGSATGTFICHFGLSFSSVVSGTDIPSREASCISKVLFSD